MTISEIKACGKDTLTTDDVAKVVGIGSARLKWQAKTDPDKLGFPVIVAGDSVRIPRMGFLRYMEYGRVSVVDRD